MKEEDTMEENTNRSSILPDTLKSIKQGDMRRKIVLNEDGEFEVIDGPTDDATKQDVTEFTRGGFA